MELQIEKETLQEHSTKVKTNASALLWLIGATVAAFIIDAIVVAAAKSFPISHWMQSDIAYYGGMLILIFLPAIFLHWRKIRLGKTATTALTVLCSISLLMDLLFVGLIFLFPGAVPWGFVLVTCYLLIWGIFVRTSLLVSLLKISENSKRTLRLVLLSISVLEIALMAGRISV